MLSERIKVKTSSQTIYSDTFRVLERPYCEKAIATNVQTYSFVRCLAFCAKSTQSVRTTSVTVATHEQNTPTIMPIHSPGIQIEYDIRPTGSATPIYSGPYRAYTDIEGNTLDMTTRWD